MADLGDLILQLKLDDDQYKRGLDEAEKRARNLKDIPVGLNPDRSFREVNRTIDQLKRERIQLEAQLNTDAAFEKLDKEIQKLERRRIRLDANVTGVEAQLQKVNADIDKLERERIRLQSDPSATIQDLRDIGNRIDILDSRRIKLNVSRNEAINDIQEIESRLNGIEDERVNIDLNAANARSRIAEIDDELDKAARSSNNFGSSFGALQGVIAGASAAIVDNLINIVGRLADIPRQIAAISLGNFRDFDAELQQFSALTGQARDQLQPLTDEIQRLGVETTKAPTEVAAAANALVTLGASAEDVQDQLAGVVALSESTGTGLLQAAELTQLAANAFGSSSEEIADKLSTLRNTTAADVGDVQQLLQQTSGIFNALGDSADPDELLALFATLRDGSLNAEVAATGLRGVIATLVDKGKAGDLENLGVEAFDATGNFIGFEAVLRQLQQTQSELNPEDFTGRLVAAFGREGVATITTGLDLLDTKFATTFQNIQNSTGTAAQTSATLTEGFAGSLKILEGSLETLSIAFGGALAPLVQFFAESLTQLANQLLTTEGIFDPITTAINKFKTSLAGNPELLASVTNGIIQLISLSIDGIAGLFQQLANFFSQPGNVEAFVVQLQNFVTAIVSLGNLAGTIVNLTVTFTSLFNSVTNIIQQIPIVGQVITALLNPVGLLTATFNTLKPLLDGVNAAFSAAGPIIDALSSPFETLGNIIDGIIRRIDNLLGRVQEVQGIGGSLGSAAGAAGTLFESATARKHGGPVIPGKTYLAGEAGPELVKVGDATGLITKPSLMKFDKPGRIFSAPQTRQKLSNSNAQKHSMPTQLGKMNKLLADIAGQRGDVNTTVQLEGISPEAMRRELARHQIQVYRGMARRYGY